MFLEGLKVPELKKLAWIRSYYHLYRPAIVQLVESTDSKLDDAFLYIIDKFMQEKKNEKKKKTTKEKK